MTDNPVRQKSSLHTELLFSPFNYALFSAKNQGFRVNLNFIVIMADLLYLNSLKHKNNPRLG